MVEIVIPRICFLAAKGIRLQYKRYQFVLPKVLNGIAKPIELHCQSLSFALFSLRNRVENTYFPHSEACFPTF